MVSEEEVVGIEHLDNEHEVVQERVDDQERVVEHLDNDVETEYDSSDNDGKEGDEDLTVDEENEINEPDVEDHLFVRNNSNVEFNILGVTSQMPDQVNVGDEVRVVDVDGFDNEMGSEEDGACCRRMELKKLRKAFMQVETDKERNVGPSGSKGPMTRIKKRKSSRTVSESQASRLVVKEWEVNPDV
ncbi:hypothetical protein Tco_0753252 [Tanacetum coccineum]